MVENDRIVAALLAAADAAELLPFVLDKPPHAPHSCNHRHRVGGLFLTVVCGGIVGQTLPPVDQAWLAMSAFDHLTAAVPSNQSKIDPKSELASVLRRRMRFLELLVRVSMTPQCDWQTSLQDCVASTKAMAGTTIDNALQQQQSQSQQQQQRFSWCHVLRKLTGDTWTSASSHRALYTLRWSHPRFLIQWERDPIPENLPEMLKTFLIGVALDHQATGMDEDEWLASHNGTLRELLKPPATMRHRVVELGLSLCNGRVTTSLLFNIMEVLERFAQSQQQQHENKQKRIHRGYWIEFRVSSLLFTGVCSITGRALETLGQLVRRSRHLHLQELRLPQLSDVEDQCLQRCLSDLTSPSATARRLLHQDNQLTRRLQRLMVGHDAKPSYAMVSATVRCDTTSSSALQEVTVAYSAMDMRGVAAWLAFGFFHADSCSHVRPLCLRMPGSGKFNARIPPYATCSRQFVETFTRVLRHVVASEELAPLVTKTTKGDPTRKQSVAGTQASPLDELPLPDDKRVFVELKPSTKARTQPRTCSDVIATLARPMAAADCGDSNQLDSDASSGAEPHGATQYHVIRRLRDWLAVVVRGYGAGWIPVSAVVKESFVRRACRP